MRTAACVGPKCVCPLHSKAVLCSCWVRLRFVAVMEWNDDLALCFIDECKAHGVLLGTTHKCHEVVLKENSAWVDVPKNIACSVEEVKRKIFCRLRIGKCDQDF